MKATYFLALVALFAVSANACGGQHGGVDNSKIQHQEANGNNAQGASSDGSLIGVPGLAQGGINVLSDKKEDVDITQGQKQ